MATASETAMMIVVVVVMEIATSATMIPEVVVLKFPVMRDSVIVKSNAPYDHIVVSQEADSVTANPTYEEPAADKAVVVCQKAVTE
jgi:hypothetical protein